MNYDYIGTKGAREDNLKNTGIRIPRDEFVIVTNVPGSGGTSLVFNIVYVEG